MGMIKNKNGKDIKAAEEIKKRWQEYIYVYRRTSVYTYTEELYKKGLNNHDGMVTRLEPDTWKCEVKGALGSLTTKIVEVMEFQLSFFKS